MVDKLHVNVDITSDVVCPWCWVGKRHLDSAIETLSGEFEFHVHWKPFLLNPGMPDEGEPLEQHLRNKYGDAAIQRFLSDDSPLKQAGRAVVRTYLVIFKHFNSFYLFREYRSILIAWWCRPRKLTFCWHKQQMKESNTDFTR
jgi:hypothetical protein